jgi:hypothetical protein
MIDSNYPYAHGWLESAIESAILALEGGSETSKDEALIILRRARNKSEEILKPQRDALKARFEAWKTEDA